MIDAKCLVSTKYLPTEKRLIFSKCWLATKTSLPSVKSLPTTKSLAFTKLLLIDKHLIDKNLSNMTDSGWFPLTKNYLKMTSLSYMTDSHLSNIYVLLKI